jgi:hypothetical protein
MSRDNPVENDLTARLWAMPIHDRLSILVLSIIENDPVAAQVSAALVHAVETLTQGCGVAVRSDVAARMRRAADRLEDAKHRLDAERDAASLH